MTGEQVSHFILPCPYPKVSEKIAKSLGIAPETCQDQLQAEVGDTGTAHPFLMLCNTLKDAKPGDVVVLATLSQGVDAIVLRVTDEIEKYQNKFQMDQQLTCKVVEENYLRFLAF